MRLTIITFLILLSGVVTAQQGDKLHLQDFEGFTNSCYSMYLAQDGWPVDLLNTSANVDYLSDEEKNLILAINLARYNPSLFSQLYVYPRLQYFDNTLFSFPGKIPVATREGLEPVRELYLELLETEALQILYPSKGLSNAASSHAVYMKNTCYAGHQGQGGLSARISRQGKWEKGIAENLCWGATNAHEAVMTLLIDDGIRSRSHRKNILNPKYEKVGVALDEHPRRDYSWVINFAVIFNEK